MSIDQEIVYVECLISQQRDTQRWRKAGREGIGSKEEKEEDDKRSGEQVDSQSGGPSAKSRAHFLVCACAASLHLDPDAETVLGASSHLNE